MRLILFDIRKPSPSFAPLLLFLIRKNPRIYISCLFGLYRPALLQGLPPRLGVLLVACTF